MYFQWNLESDQRKKSFIKPCHPSYQKIQSIKNLPTHAIITERKVLVCPLLEVHVSGDGPQSSLLGRRQGILEEQNLLPVLYIHHCSLPASQLAPSDDVCVDPSQDHTAPLLTGRLSFRASSSSSSWRGAWFRRWRRVRWWWEKVRCGFRLQGGYRGWLKRFCWELARRRVQKWWVVCTSEFRSSHETGGPLSLWKCWDTIVRGSLGKLSKTSLKTTKCERPWLFGTPKWLHQNQNCIVNVHFDDKKCAWNFKNESCAFNEPPSSFPPSFPPLGSPPSPALLPRPLSGIFWYSSQGKMVSDVRGDLTNQDLQAKVEKYYFYFRAGSWSKWINRDLWKLYELTNHHTKFYKSYKHLFIYKSLNQNLPSQQIKSLVFQFTQPIFFDSSPPTTILIQVL